jgi:hypothetical protein
MRKQHEGMQLHILKPCANGTCVVEVEFRALKASLSFKRLCGSWMIIMSRLAERLIGYPTCPLSRVLFVLLQTGGLTTENGVTDFEKSCHLMNTMKNIQQSMLLYVC